MPPRKKKKTYRRRFTGINAVNAAEAIIQANILTQGLFRADPAQFLLGWDSGGYGRGDLAVSGAALGVGELLGLGSGDTMTAWESVMSNAKNNGVDMLLKGAVVTASFRIGKKLFSRQRRQMNRGIKMLGLESVVRV
tara:strand:+ start:395 stop:805 length:411 start_codon:yes stop_codon:yes gene_type:complete